MTSESAQITSTNRLFKIAKYLLKTVLVILFIVASMISYTIGMSPEDGDTYSNPLTNLSGTIIIICFGLFAWIRSCKKSDSPDVFAAWLHSKTTKRDTDFKTDL